MNVLDAKRIVKNVIRVLILVAMVIAIVMGIKAIMNSSMVKDVQSGIQEIEEENSRIEEYNDRVYSEIYRETSAKYEDPEAMWDDSVFDNMMFKEENEESVLNELLANDVSDAKKEEYKLKYYSSKAIFELLNGEYTYHLSNKSFHRYYQDGTEHYEIDVGDYTLYVGYSEETQRVSYIAVDDKFDETKLSWIQMAISKAYPDITSLSVEWDKQTDWRVEPFGNFMALSE